MTTGSYHPAATDLETWSSHRWRHGFQIDAMPIVERLWVRTRKSTYEITVLCPGTGEVLIRGGEFFREYTSARLAGSSLGGSILKLRGVYVGFRMELQHDRHTIVTTEVQSIERLTYERALSVTPANA